MSSSRVKNQSSPPAAGASLPWVELFSAAGLAGSVLAAAWIRFWPHPRWAGAALLLATLLTVTAQVLAWSKPGSHRLPKTSLAALVLALLLSSLQDPNRRVDSLLPMETEPALPANPGTPPPELPGWASEEPLVPPGPGSETREGPRESLLESTAEGPPLRQWVGITELREQALPKSLRAALLEWQALVWLEAGQSPLEPERGTLTGLRLGPPEGGDADSQRRALTDLLKQLKEERIDQLEVPLLDDELSRALEPLSGLRRLTISGDHQLTESGWMALVGTASRARRLTEFRLRGRSLGDSSWSPAVWRSVADLKSLKVMELRHLTIDLAELGRVAKRSEGLRELSLTECRFTPETGLFPVFTGVVTLDLSGSRLKSTQLTPLAQMANLQVLLLERMDGGGAWESGTCEKFESLRRLSLRGTPCSMEGALRLTRMKRLRVLDLNETGLSPQELESIQRTANPELRLSTR